MKDKKTNFEVSASLTPGISKKKKWPWLFVIAAILLSVAFYSMVAVEFFWFKRCTETPACATFYDYTFHYKNTIDYLLIADAALVVVAILCAIFFPRKRSTAITQAPAVLSNATTPAVSTTTVTLPTSTEGKIRYFQKLHELGIITYEQFQKYCETVLTTDFPSLY